MAIKVLFPCNFHHSTTLNSSVTLPSLDRQADRDSASQPVSQLVGRLISLQSASFLPFQSVFHFFNITAASLLLKLHSYTDNQLHVDPSVSKSTLQFSVTQSILQPRSQGLFPGFGIIPHCFFHLLS